MIAFREEIARILVGVEGETNLIGERMQRERGDFDLYAWGQENLKASPEIAQVTILDPTVNSDRRRSNPILAPPISATESIFGFIWTADLRVCTSANR